MAQQKIIAVVGPTASGKSALAISLAKKINGEIISADSRQVYKGLDIGTGKVTKREMEGVKHHLLDVVSPKKIFSAHDFQKAASAAIVDIARRGKVPIICGGTGFYIDALVGRIVLPDVAINKQLRSKLDKKTTAQLFAMLKKKDPQRAATIDHHNRRRLERALEIVESLGAVPERVTSRSCLDVYETLWVGIELPASELRKRIDQRLKDRLKSGMAAEARDLHEHGLSYKRMEALGLEYRSLARFLQKKISRVEMEKELQYAIWHYAKRQISYWKRNKDIEWVSDASRQLVPRLQSRLIGK